MKRFPIQGVGSVPWAAAEQAYRAYSARYGTEQSLERLAERGGFGLAEFAVLYLQAEGVPQGGTFPRGSLGELEWKHIAARVVLVVQRVEFEVKLP